MPTFLLTLGLLANLPADVTAGERPLTTLRLTPGADGINLTFRDAEDLLTGVLEPALPRAGEPLTLLLKVEPLSGPPFTGPVTVSLRPLESMGAASTVTVAPEGRQWRATLTPPEAGPYRLEVAWRATRLKAARGQLTVSAGLLPRWFGAVFGVSLILMASIGGAWFLLRSQEKPR